MSARELPVAPSGRSAKKSFTVAQAGSSEPGYAIDYNLVTSATNQTFQSGTTYYVSGTSTLSGVTTLEGGTVIKYTNNSELRISGVLNCQTGPYRLAILTSKDDESVGESITGSTGNPSTNFAAGIALHFYVGYNFYSDLRHVRIAHARPPSSMTPTPTMRAVPTGWRTPNWCTVSGASCRTTRGSFSATC